MSTDRWKRVKHVRRPKKKKADKLRRQKTQRKRLVAIGVDEALVAKMPPHKVRGLVQKPAKAKKTLAKKSPEMKK